MSKAIFGIAFTMSQLHQRKIVHRDLKPGNIFLDENWEPRVADFGLSRSENLNMTMTIGTPLFMAPELFMDDGEGYTEKVDVFAFSIFVYQLFTNEVELDDDRPYRSSRQLMMRIGQGRRLKRLEEVPDKLWELIQECWRQEAAERPSFKTVVEKLKMDLEICMPGTDLKQYEEYQKRLIEASKENVQNPAPAGNESLKLQGLTEKTLGATQLSNELTTSKTRRVAHRFDFSRKAAVK
jgi:serine/threonine protein kinase